MGRLESYTIYIPTKFQVIFQYNTGKFSTLGKKVRGGFSREISFSTWVEPLYRFEFNDNENRNSLKVNNNWDVTGITHLTDDEKIILRKKSDDDLAAW